MTATQHPRDYTKEMLREMKFKEVSADDPGVDELVRAYHETFGLGPRNRSQERAQGWKAAIYRGKVVCVFGERIENRTLELTDAYNDGSPAGIAAFVYLSQAYMKMVRSGKFDALVHTILFANQAYWTAVVEETGDPPFALVFVHRPFVQEDKK